mmetsp:Transcript_156486/g.300121  ORF Transcript_156486/g.300121 Transcript_156486/m.300121 type:complete len:223 (-) Transcript_156486:84-752(-)
MRTCVLLLTCLASTGLAAKAGAQKSELDDFLELENLLRQKSVKKNEAEPNVASLKNEVRPSPEVDREAQAKAELEAKFGKDFVTQLEAQFKAQEVQDAEAQKEAQAKATIEAKYGKRVVAQLEAQFDAIAEAQREAQAKATLEAKLGPEFVARLEAQFEAQKEAQAKEEVRARMGPEFVAKLEAQFEAQERAQRVPPKQTKASSDSPQALAQLLLSLKKPAA